MPDDRSDHVRAAEGVVAGFVEGHRGLQWRRGDAGRKRDAPTIPGSVSRDTKGDWE